MIKPIRVLYIDDSLHDRELVRDALQIEHGGFEIVEAASRKEFEIAIGNGNFDLVLSDFNILGFEGLQVLKAVHAKYPDLPVVIVTGTGSEEIAVKAMKMGAADYIIKTPDHIRRLPHALHAALEKKETDFALRESEQQYRILFDNTPIGIGVVDLEGNLLTFNDAMLRAGGYTRDHIKDKVVHVSQLYYEPDKRNEVLSLFKKQGFLRNHPVKFKRADGTPYDALLTLSQIVFHGKPCLQALVEDVTEQKRTEAALRESEERFRTLWESTVEGIVIHENGIISEVNTAMLQMFGVTREQVIGKSLLDFAPPETRELILQKMKSQTLEPYETNIVRTDGTRVVIEVLRRNTTFQGKSMRIVAVRDITPRKQAEEVKKQYQDLLQEIQKLESLGTLASGIAHDFNNILSIIVGHASLLSRPSLPSETIRENAEAITTAAMRGASLVKQILTFARKMDVSIEWVMLNDVVNEIAKLLYETFPKTIVVSLKLDKDLPLIQADAIQIHRVLLNLCVNARDAMPGGGKLSIETRQVTGESIRSNHPKATAEEYVVLSVTDTGVGIDEETQRRIFEPFFTTKEHGKGTGLGLSMVFGIMESHDGFVSFRSDAGKETSFHCHFPVQKLPQDIAQTQDSEREEVQGGNETILVVEDEEMLRQLVKIILEEQGYTVLTAGDGEEGLAVYKQHKDSIALVLSDFGLPRFTGHELYRKLTQINPTVLMILASGYIEPGMKAKFLEEGVKVVIQKPYAPDEVLLAIRDVLDKA
ncbi:PAS domain S-box protein [bacterium]|nr:PAS domain S-box protein [bacterium]